MAINYLHSFPVHKNKDIGIFFFLHAGDVWFSLNSTTYQNNSLVTLEDIGENNNSLFCMTQLLACCRQSHAGSVLGNWLFPNETRVPSSANKWDFYRARGQSVVRLHRRRGGMEGIYHCEIPDLMNVIQIMYIGMYSASTGKVLVILKFQVSSLSFKFNLRFKLCLALAV